MSEEQMKMNNPSEIMIEEWGHQHSRWSELLELAGQLNQRDWFTFTAEWHSGSHVLVALRGAVIVGFLRFVLQEIGPDSDCPPVQWKGKNLQEAKVLVKG